MHEYFVSPGLVDMSEVRKKANRSLRDKRDPEESNIHAHKHGDQCNENCEGLRFASEVPVALMTPNLMSGMDLGGIS